MNTKIATAPCEACGGLLPLKPILQPRRHVNKQRPCRSLPRNLQQDDEGPSSRNNDAHHARTERGSATKCNPKCESSGELEAGLRLLSDDSYSETDESSGKMRSYDSVLEEIQAIFANQKVKRETISPYMHRDHRRSSKPRRHKRGPQAHQEHAVISPRASEPERHKRPSQSPADANSSPCVLHPRENIINEHTRTRIVRPSPHDDASNCSFDPLRISPSPRLHAAQSCAHHLGEHSAREQARGEFEAPATGGSSPPKQKEYKGRHEAVDNNHRDTAPREPNAQPRTDNPDCYQDILQLYENCHIHQIDEHITATLTASPRRSSQRHGCEERSPVQLQPQQQIIYSCHQHTVVQHHEGSCHLHRLDPESPPARSPRLRNSSRKCQRCGCPKAASPQGQPADRRHTIKASVKPERRSPEQREVIASTQRLSPRCKMHGDCGKKQQQPNVDVCGVCCHPKKDHKAALEDQSCPPALLQHSSSKNRHDSPSPAIQGCPLHGLPNPKSQEPKRDAATNSKCNEPKDPLVWTPRRVWKPKQCSSVYWLDRLVASQKFPAHIIQQFLQGKRKCPPRVKKPRCAACFAKCRNLCEREFRDSDPAIVECHKEQPRREKLSRLALSRSLIIKPVLKLSTAQRTWSTRKEFQVCSECRNPLHSKSGRWKSILEEMSAGLRCEEEAIPKNRTGMKFSCQTIHELVLPSGAGSQDLRCPELYSAFRLHWQLQKLQNEKFDRRAALQVAQTEGIELDKELFDQFLPEIKIPNKGSRRRRAKASPRNNSVCRHQQQRREVYHDLCKIVDPPMPVCQVQGPLRDVGVQVSNPGRPPQNRNLWNPKDFSAEPCAQSDRRMQSPLAPYTPKPTNWPKQEQLRCQQALEKSWDEQHWAYLVEACKQARMKQGVYGSCAACQ